VNIPRDRAAEKAASQPTTGIAIGESRMTPGRSSACFVRQAASHHICSPTIYSDDLFSGRVVSLLSGWRAGDLSFNVVYPARRMMPRRVPYVIDTIIGQREELLQETASSE